MYLLVFSCESFAANEYIQLWGKEASMKMSALQVLVASVRLFSYAQVGLKCAAAVLWQYEQSWACAAWLKLNEIKLRHDYVSGFTEFPWRNFGVNGCCSPSAMNTNRSCGCKIERIVQLNILSDSILTLIPFNGDFSRYNLANVPTYPQIMDEVTGQVKFNPNSIHHRGKMQIIFNWCKMSVIWIVWYGYLCQEDHFWCFMANQDTYGNIVF